MSENKESKGTFGQIQIADEVIAIIAGTAALEVEGVEAAGGSPTNTLVEFFGKKNQSKGVKVSVDEREANIELDIAVKFGMKIQEIAEEVQKKVKNAVETMTGLSVSNINVNICGITTEKVKTKIEMEEE